GQTSAVPKKLISPNSAEILLPRIQKDSQSQKTESAIPRRSPNITHRQPPNANLPDITRSFKDLENDLCDHNFLSPNLTQLTQLYINLCALPSGCSDSRVPAEIIAKLGFGEIFVHRNIANQFKEDDVNCMSELEFAVHNLKVEHIIVCGIQNAYKEYVLRKNLKFWLSDIRKIKDSHPELFPDQITESKMNKSEIDAIHKKLVSINVINQVNKISENEVVKEAWKDEKRKLSVHGWIFNMENGHLEDLYVTRNKSSSFCGYSYGYTPSFNGSGSYTDGDNTGGFMGSTDYASGSQEPKPTGDRKRSVRHVTIKQLLNAATQHSDSEYQIDDLNVSSQNVIEYKIDDGTGFIDAKVWFESEEKKESSAAYKISSIDNNNSYVGSSHVFSDPLHKEIRDLVVNQGDPHMGLPIERICSALGFQYGSDNAIDVMISDGILYNTQDDSY
ncbi:6647_t:CDS:2, partial [Racocetra fulgida]